MSWEPPAGMLPKVVTEWRAFYRAALINYGVTPELYRATYLAQLGRCYICRKAKGVHPDDPKGLGGRRLAIDHNHVIGNRVEAFRGLLCSGGDKTCNRIIGWLSPEALERAADYVYNAPGQQVIQAMADGFTTDWHLKGYLIHDEPS